MPRLADNKKAHYDYEILDKYEAGIVLSGQEVKSVRGGRMNLAGSRVLIKGGEAFLLGAQIAPYERAGKMPDYDPQQTRKLLLRSRELNRIAGKLEEKGLTAVPISAYTKGSFVKIEVAVVRGKKQYEKREEIKKRDINREIRRSLKR